MAKKSSETILVRWVRSGIGFSYHQKRMVRSLGLRRLNQTVELQDTPSNRGLVARIPHLVEIVRPETRPSGTPVPEFSIHAAEASPVSKPKPAQREEIEEAAGPAAPETSTETAESKE